MNSDKYSVDLTADILLLLVRFILIILTVIHHNNVYFSHLSQTLKLLISFTIEPILEKIFSNVFTVSILLWE